MFGQTFVKMTLLAGLNEGNGYEIFRSHPLTRFKDLLRGGVA